MHYRRPPVFQLHGQTTMTTLRLLTLTCLCLGILAVARTPSPARAAEARYFPETGHNVPGFFAAYWAAQGGLAQFGLPLTEPYDSDAGVTIQWFERARFERHPRGGNAAAEVILGQLGREVRPPDPAAEPIADPGVRFFPESGHNLGLFRGYWEGHGGLARFGFPLSEEVTEVNAADGGRYAVQYFERARLEYHPAANGL
jgi:hypothetical protein